VDALDDLAARALAEDVGTGDITAEATVPAGARARAQIVQKAPGVIAGLSAAERVFRAVDREVTVQPRVAEGEWRDGGPVLDLEGSARGILAGERTALNLLGRLSGVATLTARYVEAVDGTGCAILDTRNDAEDARAGNGPPPHLPTRSPRRDDPRDGPMEACAPTARKRRNTRADHTLSIGGARLARVKNLEG
jgi:hypothetical protein